MCENLLAEALRRADDDLMVFGTGVLELRDGNVRHVPLSDIWLDTDAELMTKAEIIMRRTEGRLLHKYGARLLAVSCFGDLLMLMVPKLIDQEAMYREIADSFYPEHPVAG